MIGHRFIWLRATGSTILSQMIDSFAVSVVFLVGTKPTGFFFGNAVNNYLGKLAMAVLLTPLIYLGHAIFTHWFKLPERDEVAAS